MKQAIQQIQLNKLIPSDANVRHTGRMNGVSELAASIKAHGLLQNLAVRRVTKGKNKAVLYEVIAGGRRLAALKSLVKAKQLKKESRVACHVLNGEIAEEISLAENQHEPMHPADQYEAFALLHREHGLSIEDIAARFGVTPTVVRQRLKLGAVSVRMLALYREGEMNLDQLTAFTITDDHARQEQVWDDLGEYASRRAITHRLSEGQISISDRRAVFVGLDAYEAAGGTVIRDLFDEEAGYLKDTALLNRLVREKLQRIAEPVMAEGWKWVEINPEFDYQHTCVMATIDSAPRPLNKAEQAECDDLQERLEALNNEAEQNDPSTDVVSEIEQLEQQIDVLTKEMYRPEDIARAGVFIALGHKGEPRIERGYLRPEDAHSHHEKVGDDDIAETTAQQSSTLSAALVADLTAHLTSGLRNDLAQAPELALIAVTHALAAETFYRGDHGSCLEIAARQTPLVSIAEGIDDTVAGCAIAERHRSWADRLPNEPSKLWSVIASMTMDDVLALLAHCASLTLNAVQRPGAIADDNAHADVLARAMPFDMSRYWQPTVANYLGRVSKECILAAVTEGAGEGASQQIVHLKKQAMAAKAEELLSGKNWLPPLLRPVA